MIFSVVTYLTFALLLCALAIQDVRLSKKVPAFKNSFTYYSWLFILVFSIVSGFRYKLGADCESYVLYYMKAHFAENELKGEYLFGIVNSFLYNCGFGRVVFLGFWAFVEIFFVYSALQTRKYILPFFAIVLVLGPHYYTWMNGIRQMVATCIFVYAIQQKIDNKRYILYIILIYISSFIHRSALLLFLFVILPNINYFKNRYLAIGLVIVCAFLGQSGWVREPLNMLSTVSYDGEFGYEGYTSRMEIFTDIEGLGYGPRRLIILFVSLICIWFQPIMLKRYNDKFLLFCYTATVLSAIFPENLLSSVHSSMSRPFLYLKPLKLIFNAYLLYFLYHEYSNKKLIFFYPVLVLSVCYMLIESVVVADNPNEATLFKFIFLQ